MHLVFIYLVTCIMNYSVSDVAEDQQSVFVMSFYCFIQCHASTSCSTLCFVYHVIFMVFTRVSFPGAYVQSVLSVFMTKEE